MAIDQAVECARLAHPESQPKLQIMTQSDRQNFSFLVPLGRIAVFYVPAAKMDDPAFGREGVIPRVLFERFFLERFGGLTHEESKIRGQWTSPDGQKVFTDLHERFEVSFAGKDKTSAFLDFLSEMCGLLQEESIYLTMGTRSWLVKPPTSRS
jgi:hypothetical protein